MSNDINKHGLSRYIPEDVKLEVRQRCGFGCIICGNAIVEYDHFEPEFSEAKSHDSEAIILLCPYHHSKKSKKLLSKETVRKAMQNPKSKEQGFSYDVFDITEEHIELVLGPLSIPNPKTIIQVLGEDILAILPPESPGAPFRINAKILNKDGKVILRIHENEWKIPSDTWDIKQKGNSIVINNKHGEIALSIKFKPPNRIIIQRLNMVLPTIQFGLKANEDCIKILAYGGVIVLPGKVKYWQDSRILFNITRKLGTTETELGMPGYITNPYLHIQRIPFVYDKEPNPKDICLCKSNLIYKLCCGKL